MYCKVIVPAPFDKEFIYKYSENIPLQKGHIVQIPFGNRNQQIGIVSNIIVNKEKIDSKIKIKEIKEIVNGIKLSLSVLEFANWVSNYTLNPIGLILKMILPNYKIISYKLKEEKVKKNIKKPLKIKLNVENRRE